MSSPSWKWYSWEVRHLLSAMGEAGSRDHEKEGGGGRHLGRGRAGQPRCFFGFCPCSQHWCVSLVGVSVWDQGCPHLCLPSRSQLWDSHVSFGGVEASSSSPACTRQRSSLQRWRSSPLEGFLWACACPVGVLPYRLPRALQVTPEILASAALLLFNCRSISAV